jgi:radical SAM-linked protein
LRFSSHRDFQRAFERALRRAGVPMAFSAGFSPHPKVSYANAAPTGVASEAEYLEIGVAERCDPERVRAALDASLPPGLDVLEVVEAGPGSLVERLEASVYEIRLPGVAVDAAEKAVSTFLGQAEVEVERMTKNGLRTFDARGAVVSLAALDPSQATMPDATMPDATMPPGAGAGGSGVTCAILRLVVRHTTPVVRPDDVLAALRRVAYLEPPVPPQVTRLAQGPLDTAADEVADPLVPDRD